MPERLSEQGRLPIPEFTKFVAGKLANGDRWEKAVARLMPSSDSDAKEYKKFYKDYEAKNRIAMFGLEDKEKLFLVTPKFHKAARDFVTFQNPTSTYAVILLRRRR